MIEWLENHMGSCAFKAYAGMDCPGCGMQRAFIELLKGNLFASIQYYPGLIPMLITLVFLGLHLMFNFKHGALVLKIMFIFTVIIIMTTYIIKILTNYTFSFS
ncbi:MAG: DUF2752 domain-containing protein [Candidatus Delongbacteria bacterium]|jgi:hypothetical protein|nr:DUF2752 domain-containing protein [Candidatus Delongbacteria bacterium]